MEIRCLAASTVDGFPGARSKARMWSSNGRPLPATPVSSSSPSPRPPRPGPRAAPVRRIALVLRRPNLRASPENLPSRRRRQVERCGTRAGHGGVVTRSHVTNLRKGRIESPGMDKLAARARAMGFPPALWFDEEPTGADGREPRGGPKGSRAGSGACSRRSRTPSRQCLIRTPGSPA
jgi:hypothetical protein